MTVIRRLDAIVEPTKQAVLTTKQHLDTAKVGNQHAALCQASGEAFYNTSLFILQQQLRADFEAYLDGISPNVQDILEKFRFRNQPPGSWMPIPAFREHPDRIIAAPSAPQERIHSTPNSLFWWLTTNSFRCFR